MEVDPQTPSQISYGLFNEIPCANNWMEHVGTQTGEMKYIEMLGSMGTQVDRNQTEQDSLAVNATAHRVECFLPPHSAAFVHE